MKSGSSQSGDGGAGLEQGGGGFLEQDGGQSLGQDGGRLNWTWRGFRRLPSLPCMTSQWPGACLSVTPLPPPGNLHYLHLATAFIIYQSLRPDHLNSVMYLFVYAQILN